MRILPKLHLAVLLVALTTSSFNVEAQCYGDECYDSEDCAYMQSSHAAHWSAYVPIAALIAAGICWSLADKNHSCASSHCNSNSYNGLGPLDRTSNYNCSCYSLSSSFAH
ncbi:MAG: hypothetical protein H0V82_06930 [Candidatus Protochlamydia sp.]|nr:hypothetical protein [Candidatus Protochlamydia sp.]